MSQPASRQADNWRVEGKYDYFLTDPRNYLGVNLGFRSNEFADIDQRSYAAPTTAAKS